MYNAYENVKFPEVKIWCVSRQPVNQAYCCGFVKLPLAFVWSPPISYVNSPTEFEFCLRQIMSKECKKADV